MPTATFPELIMGSLFRSIHKNAHTKYDVRSFTRSSDNTGYPKNLGSPWRRPRSLFSKSVHGFVFAYSLPVQYAGQI